ncbi:tyrosine-type recombinase/integrase [Christiangramia sp.]|uniref:tyrosine-type recombinase/integrase n=1 Tax=Christiangramia sp. TaxID=1931228 RepID=UPI00262E4E0B|nr:tyrosine-type recombinase/integrase [Christiangramia sp.]
MATINFLYRSTRERAFLEVRLLFRINHPGEYRKKKNGQLYLKKTKKDDPGEPIEYTDYVITGRTKLEVSKNYWKTQHAQKRVKDITIRNKQNEINQEINNIENHLLNAFNDAEPKEVNKEWLSLQIDRYYNPPSKNKAIPNKLVDYIDFYIDYRKHELKQTSITKYNVIKHKMERLQAKRRKPILIKEINESFKREFVEYYKQEQYSINTTQRELGFIKTFCKHARSLQVETHPQLEQLKLKKQKVEKIYLDPHELEKIEKKNLLAEHLDNARDWLIISCNCGQRISDFMRFRSNMIREENGKKFIDFTQKKTGKLMTIPLSKKILEILEKRKGEFPRAISHQKYNNYIKDVCREAGLNTKTIGSKQVEIKKDSGIYRKQTKEYKKYELITSHVGRRSFATNNYGKVPTTFISFMTGHSSEIMLLSYLGKSNKDLALESYNYFY